MAHTVRMDITFAELGLNEQILEGVSALGFTTPTPVQAQAIPAVLEGRDVVASAQTGTGKTAAFTLPALQVILGVGDAPAEQEAPETPADPDAPAAPKPARRRKHLPRDRGPHALVVTPTRELAQQIDRVAATVAQATGQHVVTVIGGERYDRQVNAIKRGCDMLVATPGRLIDLMEGGSVDLSHVRVLVLDEADRMLDMGFWPSVRKIIAKLPRERQTLLFSATISGDIQQSMPTMLKDPVTVEISRAGTAAETVEQRLVPVVQGQKVSLLAHLIEQGKPARVLVFCKTKQRVDSVAASLERAGLKVGVMHADRRQKEREQALEGFRSGKLGALVATDVMSRGIDVDGIDWVVNFDVPMDPEDYVHRIGRTGRAGRSGEAFTFMAPDEVSPLREIEYFTKQLVPVWEPEGFEFGAGRIVPNEKRACTRSARSMFSGSRGGRGRGPAGGRFGRHT